MKAAEIVKKLTTAQKREIVSDAPWFMAGLTGQRQRHVVWLGLHERSIAPCITACLATCHSGWWQLTDLGLEVRTMLMKAPTP